MTNHTLDRLSGWIFVIIGLLVTYGAWMMPRFADRGASVYEAPGLTPGVLGLFLTICGLVMAFRPRLNDGDSTNFWNTIAGRASNRKRAITALILTLGYGAGLFGKVGFIPATMLFVFLFIVAFEIYLPSPTLAEQKRPVWRTLTVAAVTATVFAIATHWTFTQVFLVQLP